MNARSLDSVLAVVVSAACVTTASAEPPAACGTVSVPIEQAESLFRSGNHDSALHAIARIPIVDLPAECRVYVKSMRARLLIATDRGGQARDIYASMLDEVPSWRPDADVSSREVLRIFEEARASWVRSNAGPLRVTPSEVSLLSAASDVQSSTQPLLIQAMQQGEISWRVRSTDPWIRLSRAQGTTSAGRDTLVVSARTFADGESSLRQRGRLIFEAPPWPEVAVDISWHVMAPAANVESQTSARGRRLLLIGLGAVIVGGVIGVLAN